MHSPQAAAAPQRSHPGDFWFQGRHGIDVVDYVDFRANPGDITEGSWAVVTEFDGSMHAWRMASVHECDANDTCVIPLTSRPAPATLPAPAQWRSSLDWEEYERVVEQCRGHIQRGAIEQANVCRILSSNLPHPPSARSMFQRIAATHPSPYGGWVDIPAGLGPGMWLASASPELAWEVTSEHIRARPIKGTAGSARELLAEDYRENRLVTKALIDELADVGVGARISESCAIEEHPGLVQLVSTVTAPHHANPDPAALLAKLTELLPPLSVAGVPRQAATAFITTHEPAPRGPYCGSFGWLDFDRGEATLAATIRTFWWRDGRIHFGTGAGITQGSDPRAEWQETVLKAHRLLQIVAGGQ